MFFYHHSHNEFCRQPFGAVRQGTAVTLRALCDEPVTLRLWDGQEHLLPMRLAGQLALCDLDGYAETKDENPPYDQFEDEKTPHSVFEVTLPGKMTAKAGLLWYYFITESGARFAAMDPLGGLCVRHEDGTPLHSQQITVYDRDFQTPEWMRGAVVYQLFPDRFFDGLDGARLKKKRRTEKSVVVHQDKTEPPFVIANGDGPDGIDTNDFYGGNLLGIRMKMGELVRLGINTIYLNPIFEAASNHRYDTANYERIDRFLGSNEDFSALCREAKRRGLRIILDGVFSHTGANSVYFDKEGCFGGVGAYRNPDSPYRSWFRFKPGPDGQEDYECWWNIRSLPCVNEMDPSYLDYMVTGKNAIVARWLKRGASGWRLDVADELPDAFIEAVRSRVKKENPDAALIGEVWEDATNKISYDKLRTYALGSGLDSVMNYPLRRALISFFLGDLDSAGLKRALEAQREHYPTPMYYVLMNLIGTHDRSRILNVLGECDDQSIPRAQQRDVRMTPEQRALGKARLKRMLRVICALPGMPSVYYGDEAGMEGMRDPLCRGYYPWGNEDEALKKAFRQELEFRSANPVLKDGFVAFSCPDEDSITIRRFYRDGRNVFGQPASGCDVTVTVSRKLK